MFGPKLRRADQPFWKRLALGIFEFAASLGLAVILISSCAFSLAWATFVESAYGTEGVRFGMYGTWWFALLNLCLAINIFCAAAIRYPWKRYQTGFVITHIGLLTLLFGCLISRRNAIDAQMPVFEDQMGHRAFERSNHFQFSVERNGGDKAEVVTVPFASGPFNWDDYVGRLSRPINPVEKEGWLMQRALRAFARFNGFLFGLAHRDRGLIYDRNGIQLEVLDYYADSVHVDTPLLKMQMTVPRAQQHDDEGKLIEGAERWMPINLTVGDGEQVNRKFGLGKRERVGGGSLALMLAGDAAEVDAFLQSAPEGSLGEKGQIVLFADGEVTRVNVDDKLEQGRFSLGKAGLEAEITSYRPGDSHLPSPAVQLKLYRDDKEAGKLVLFSDNPEFSLQDYDNRVFGNYWFDHGEKTAADLLQGGGGSRIDILQGPLAADGKAKLYYRYWNRKQSVAAELPADGTPVNAFKMPIAQLKMKVDQLIPGALPEKRFLPVAFDAKKPNRLPVAKLRLTVDAKANEFWLAAIPGTPDEQKLSSAQQRQFTGDQRLVTITMPPDEVDIGFRVRLRDFERKLDPGTSQPSHYSSIVDFVDLRADRTLQKDVLITMNAPVDFSDPGTGKSYRLFQESFFGPIRSDDPEFEKYAGKGDRDEIYMSTLTVNYDPGRPVTYIGCLLILLGIVMMFYMRAYFFKPSVKPVVVAAAPKRKRQPVGSGR